MQRLKLAVGPLRIPFLILTPACVLLGYGCAIWSTGRANGYDTVAVLVGALAAHVAVNAPMDKETAANDRHTSASRERRVSANVAWHRQRRDDIVGVGTKPRASGVRTGSTAGARPCAPLNFE